MDGNSIHIAPSSDEIEVSVFGPGYGECILLHVGDNNWFIIDSCIDPVSKNPVPLIYLNQINRDPAICVRQVIATHWHDDHIRGLAKIIKASSSADFICSDAIKPGEFLQLLTVYGNRVFMENSGVNEFQEVLKVLEERAHLLGNKYISPTFAIANRRLWKGSPGSTGLHYNCSIYSLSPSDASVLAAKLDFQGLLPREKEPKRRLIAVTPNHTAVVIWVNIKGFNILLGSDLEETTDPYRGWSVIINSTSRPEGKASFFKIPHHGSKNAHHPRVWLEMCEKDPVAVLTPYEKGNNSLPTKEDVERICSLTGKAFSTAILGKKQRIKRNSTVEKTIRETVRNIRPVYTSIGHVRLRVKPDRQYKIECFGDALPLKALYAS